MAFGRFFTKAKNTKRAGGSPPSLDRKEALAQAGRLLKANPGADRRDLVDALVQIRQGKSKFRGLPEDRLPIRRK